LLWPGRGRRARGAPAEAARPGVHPGGAAGGVRLHAVGHRRVGVAQHPAGELHRGEDGVEHDREPEPRTEREPGPRRRDDQADAKAFERNFGITYPSLVDPDGQLQLRFRDSPPPTSIPSTPVIDREGRVASRTKKPLKTL